ncbi:hypothetical protein [Nonomuraea lactucae]|uniref:hypothetical protein n=1 Tax=Nonomuraea lactucae TaxID=2249762 RepID=UPI001F06957E|nr:hypothetical protein [Nonomuraea lactucae]
MAALQAADSADASASWTGRNEVLQHTIVDGLLAREERYWRASAEAADVTADPVLLRRCVASTGLFGLAEEAILATRLLAIPDLADAPAERRHAIARWLIGYFEHYSSDDSALIQPDLLFERLIAKTFTQGPSMFGTIVSISAPARRTALAVVARACESDQVLLGALEGEVRVHIEEIGPLLVRSSNSLRQLFRRIAATIDLPPESLSALVDAIPLDDPLLQDTAVALSKRAVDLTAVARDPRRLTTCLKQHAERQGNIGNYDAAIAASRRAVQITRRSVMSGDETAISYVKQLRILARYYTAADRHDGAIDELKQGIEFLMPQPTGTSETVLHALAGVYAEIRGIQVWLGRGEEARNATLREWEIYQSVASIADSNVREMLTESLHSCVPTLSRYVPGEALWQTLLDIHRITLREQFGNQAEQASTWFALAKVAKIIDRFKDAQHAIGEAERLARSSITVFGDHLLLLSRILREKVDLVKEDQGHALKLMREVVQIRHRLVDLTPTDEHCKGLANAYASLARRLRRMGQGDESVQTVRSYVDLRRDMALEGDGETDSASLANALSLAAEIMLQTKRPYQALAMQNERLSIDRRLAARNFERYGWGLAKSLVQQAQIYRAIRPRSHVLRVAKEAESVARKIYAFNPDADTIKLSKLLASIALLLSGADYPHEALRLFGEVEVIRRDAVEGVDPGEPTLLLARALGYHADALAVVGRWEEALRRSDEGFVLCVRALEEFPMDRAHGRRKTDTQEFYSFLIRLNGILEHLGKHEAAEHIRGQGQEILGLLAGNFENTIAARLSGKMLPAYEPDVFLSNPSLHWLVGRKYVDNTFGFEA